MIDPGIDVASATDEEIIEAYVRDGMTRAAAESYVAALRLSSEKFPVD